VWQGWWATPVLAEGDEHGVLRVNFGSVFSNTGDEQGFRPHASGLNSMRRNAMVGVQKGAEAVGYDTAMHAKKVSQHRGDGQACREKVYEDSTAATTDIGAFLMGRTSQRMEKLSSLAMTRVPELAKYRRVADVAKDDPIRVETVQQNEQRQALATAVKAYAEEAAKAKLVAKQSQARATVRELSQELNTLTGRLERQMLEAKRQQVYADGLPSCRSRSSRRARQWQM
jgi:single-stranded DNA-specific DHH superfamily exonuclease